MFEGFRLALEEHAKRVLIELAEAELEKYRALAAQFPPPTKRRNIPMTGTNISVGDVILNKKVSKYGDTEVREAIKVGMDEEWITTSFVVDRDPIDYATNPTGIVMKLTAAQAIEFGQVLLKAAETQPEYAAEAARLREEQSKLAGKYKDMISGMGLDALNDRLDDDGSLKVLEPGKSWAV